VRKGVVNGCGGVALTTALPPYIKLPRGEGQQGVTTKWAKEEMITL